MDYLNILKVNKIKIIHEVSFLPIKNSYRNEKINNNIF